MEYLIGLDVGTSAVKGALLSADGKVCATADAPFGAASSCQLPGSE